MTTKKETPEHWAQYWCADIESRGTMALSPQATSSEDQSPEKSQKRKRKVVPPITGTQDSESMVQLEKQFEIVGTRVIMAEDRIHLEAEVKQLRPAFDALSKHIKASTSSAEDLDALFQELGKLIVASYYIGAYTTVSLGVQKFVAPAVLREQAKTPQRAKAVMDMEKRQRLRAAIRRAAGGRELKASRSFANLIYDKVFAQVGRVDKEGKKSPAPKAIKNEFELMRKEGVAK
jgi:hypothetical protein